MLYIRPFKCPFQPRRLNRAFVSTLYTTSFLRDLSHKRPFKRSDGPRRLNAPAICRTLATTTDGMGLCWALVGNMIKAGGASAYWKGLFSPPTSEKLVNTFACYLFSQVSLHTINVARKVIQMLRKPRLTKNRFNRLSQKRGN